MAGSSCPVFWSTAEWARAIAETPTAGPLPERTVIVPRSRVAHQLRKELIRAGHAAALVGTLFVSPVAAALDVLTTAGNSVQPDEDSLRPARIAALLRTNLGLEYFLPSVVAHTPGWDDAFARTIGELESAGLVAGDLPNDDSRCRDLSALWRGLDESASDS